MSSVACANTKVQANQWRNKQKSNENERINGKWVPRCCKFHTTIRQRNTGGEEERAKTTHMVSYRIKVPTTDDDNDTRSYQWRRCSDSPIVAITRSDEMAWHCLGLWKIMIISVVAVCISRHCVCDFCVLSFTTFDRIKHVCFSFKQTEKNRPQLPQTISNDALKPRWIERRINQKHFQSGAIAHNNCHFDIQ